MNAISYVPVTSVSAGQTFLHLLPTVSIPPPSSKKTSLLVKIYELSAGS